MGQILLTPDPQVIEARIREEVWLAAVQLSWQLGMVTFAVVVMRSYLSEDSAFFAPSATGAALLVKPVSLTYSSELPSMVPGVMRSRTVIRRSGWTITPGTRVPVTRSPAAPSVASPATPVTP